MINYLKINDHQYVNPQGICSVKIKESILYLCMMDGEEVRTNWTTMEEFTLAINESFSQIFQMGAKESMSNLKDVIKNMEDILGNDFPGGGL